MVYTEHAYFFTLYYCQFRQHRNLRNQSLQYSSTLCNRVPYPFNRLVVVSPKFRQTVVQFLTERNPPPLPRPIQLTALGSRKISLSLILSPSFSPLYLPFSLVLLLKHRRTVYLNLTPRLLGSIPKLFSLFLHSPRYSRDSATTRRRR